MPDSEKIVWALPLPKGEPLKNDFARRMIGDPEDSDVQLFTEFYEMTSDPEYVARETKQRQMRGALFRRLRRLDSRTREPKTHDHPFES